MKPKATLETFIWFGLHFVIAVLLLLLSMGWLG